MDFLCGSVDPKILYREKDIARGVSTFLTLQASRPSQKLRDFFLDSSVERPVASLVVLPRTLVA